MPNPRVGEKDSEFIPRCMRWLMEEEGVRDEKQAYAKCLGIWHNFKNRSMGKKKGSGREW